MKRLFIIDKVTSSLSVLPGGLVIALKEDVFRAVCEGKCLGKWLALMPPLPAMLITKSPLAATQRMVLNGDRAINVFKHNKNP